MNGIQNGKTRNLEKPFPGCLGRMVNMFDLGTGGNGNRLLTDKPHLDGSTLSRSRSDVSRMSPIGDQSEDKAIVSELRRTSSNRKSDGTPIKMLIAQEMLKEVESKHNPPSVIAKLMGLDDLPRQQHDKTSRRSHSRGYSLSHSEIPSAGWQQELGFPEQDEYKDVYEIWHQSPKTNYVTDKSPQKGRINESTNEKKMALVRQKFTEAKRLATDEKLRQSKQFQDALEILSSNKDLFLKFLQEPNSLFSQHLYNLQSTTPPPETKRITVLRPSKMVDHEKFVGSMTKNEKQMKKAFHAGQVRGFSPPPPSCDLDDQPIQPTRIVVLKPSCGKPHDIKAVGSSPSSSVRTSHDEFYKGPEDDEEAKESTEAPNEITHLMCEENQIGDRRDETLLSSVFSNGYIGDVSSFNKSEIEYADGNLSDSEVMSPASRHSWDYINRFGSPYSSSFSRASYSPESSVCREAKKRLSERWAMMASNGSSQERHVRRSSSTLGEMLALSDMKKSVRSEEEGNSKNEQESRGSALCLASDLNKDENAGNSPKNLLRSKSVPVSSTVYGARLNVEVSNPEVIKPAVPKELTKSRSMKSSFKGRVSSLFFSRNKKSTKEKASQSNDEPQSAEMPVRSSGNIGDDRPRCANDTGSEEMTSPGLQGSCKSSSPDSLCGRPNQGIIPSKAVVHGNQSENQDQPSPISVLEPPFEEDDHTTPEFSLKSDRHVVELAGPQIQSNLIDKSPLIGSIARTLSWDDACSGPATPSHFQPSVASLAAKDEEQEWFFFVQTLLSASGLTDKTLWGSYLARWHSSESPLDPLLREKYINLNDKEIAHEAKRRQWRSTRNLVFDCVNAALVDIADQRLGPSTGAHHGVEDGGQVVVTVDRVWTRMKEWFSGEVRCAWGDGSEGGDCDSLVVERVVRKEVVGKGWVEQLRMEVDNLGQEIEGKLLEELLQEAVVELTDRV
ncbi:hypothetical protein LguiA_011678 [Lonicera macranthoides]